MKMTNSYSQRKAKKKKTQRKATKRSTQKISKFV